MPAPSSAPLAGRTAWPGSSTPWATSPPLKGSVWMLGCDEQTLVQTLGGSCSPSPFPHVRLSETLWIFNKGQCDHTGRTSVHLSCWAWSNSLPHSPHCPLMKIHPSR